MNPKELALAAVENGYRAEVGNLFSVLASAIVTDGDTPEGLQKALDRFQKGLEYSNVALVRASEIISRFD